MIRRLAKLSVFVVMIGALLTSCSKTKAKETEVSTNTHDSTAVSTTKPEELKTLRFGLASNTDVLSGIFGIAQSKGYLAEELTAVGYKIEILGFAQAGPAVNEAFVSEDIDIANYGDLPAVVLKSKGIGVSVVGISDTSANLSIVVPKDSDIQTVKDLEGKKVFVAIGTVIEQYWDRVVKEYGLDESKIEIINDPANALSSFISGNGDALVHVDINNGKVDAQYPVRYIDSTKATHPEWGYQGVIVARDKFAEEHPEVVTALFKAYLRAYEDAVADPEVFFNSIVQDGISYDLVKSVYGDIDISNVDGDLAQENIDKLDELNSFLYDTKLTSESVDVKSFINTTFYEEAKNALGK